MQMIKTNEEKVVVCRPPMKNANNRRVLKELRTQQIVRINTHFCEELVKGTVASHKLIHVNNNNTKITLAKLIKKYKLADVDVTMEDLQNVQ